MKPRCRVKAPTRMLGGGVPDDAVPGDLIVGNRGAAAYVVQNPRNSVLYLEYAGNYYHHALPYHGRKMYDNRGGT